jgi:type II secretion system protein H
MRREAGFTMIEMAIAVMILVLILALAVPSLNGVLADRRLRRSLDEFNGLVRQAQERSIAERRSYLIIWRDDKIGLRAEGLRSGENTAPVAMLKVNKGESFKLSFPAALENEPPAEWIFWPSGNCEPAVVTFSGVNGGWTANYSALTARPDIVNYVAK